jgi:hypothetical protein
MKFFIDTEFLERGRQFPIELISIGIVCENGKWFYAENSEYAINFSSKWLLENVIPNLTGPKLDYNQLRFQILKFIEKNRNEEDPEFWGYYADYDWVVFCQIFGSMLDLPKQFPMFCNDIKQLCKNLGNPKLPEQQSNEHNALNDAQWNLMVYNFLIK